MNIIVQKNRFGIHMVDMPPFLCDDGNINVHYFLWLAQIYIDNQSQCFVDHHGWQDEPMLCGGVKGSPLDLLDGIHDKEPY